MLEMIFKGQVLTQAQLDALATITMDAPNLSARNFRKAVDIALRNAGHPVPDIEVGQVVSWTVGLQKDKGRVVSYDERADKYRLTSKLRKREVTVPGRDVRVLPVKETADDQSETAHADQ